MFGIGSFEFIIILVVALLVLGPDKLPKLMRTFGKAAGELRRASNELQRTINMEFTDKGSSTVEEPLHSQPSLKITSEKSATGKTASKHKGRMRSTPLPRSAHAKTFRRPMRPS